MRRRTRLVSSALVVLAPLVGSGAACRAPERLAATSEEVLGLAEVSGLARGRIDGTDVLLAVGDEANEVVLVPIVKGLPDLPHARTIAVPLPAEAGGSQLEGVAFDAQGNVWLLSEGEAPALTELTISGDRATIVVRGPLVVPAGHPLEVAWAKDANARGEGLVVDDQRVLVGKQKDPAALIAFTRVDDRWVAGTWWTIATEDISDLARGADGSIYVIGARSERICKLEPLTPGGGDVRCAEHWNLPESLGKGRPQWEGLTFLEDGRPVVAVDRKKTTSPNVAVFPRLLP